MNKKQLDRINELVVTAAAVKGILKPVYDFEREKINLHKRIIFEGSEMQGIELKMEKKTIMPFLQDYLQGMEAELKELGYEGEV